MPSFHHHYHILYDIAASMKKDRIVYAEVGAYAGASAILMLHDMRTVVVSVDLGTPIPPRVALGHVHSYFDDGRYTYVQGDSRNEETKNRLRQSAPVIDLLFIDGDHTFSGVQSDFHMYSDMVRAGGFIVFDDYHCPASVEVKPAVDDIVSGLWTAEYSAIGTFENSLGAKPSAMRRGNCFVLMKSERAAKLFI